MKSLYDLPKKYEEYSYLNCSFDYQGNPNILFVKGDRKQLEEFELPVLLSEIKLDYLLIIVSQDIEVFQLTNIYENFDFAMKADENNFLFACSYFSDEEGWDYRKNCKIYNGTNQVIAVL